MGTRSMGRIALGLGLAACLACVSTAQSRRSTGVFAFLYPEGSEAAPPADVSLELPLRIGLAFAPTDSSWHADFPETLKYDLLRTISAAFDEEAFIESVEILPTQYLEVHGGWANLDQLRTGFGIDVMVLLSYDQSQLTEANNWSVVYLTIVGAFLVEGEENTTHTLLDAVVLDVPSRALLFRAAGTSLVESSMSAATSEGKLQDASARGFREATQDLIAGLGGALERFAEQVKTGTVRGIGTPAIRVTSRGGGR